MKSLMILGALVGFVPLSLTAQTAVLNDSGHYSINIGNHLVGHSDFSIQPVPQGSISTSAAYAVTSHGALTLPKTTYSFSAAGSLDKGLTILSENLNGIVNGSAVTFAVSSKGSTFAIEISASGKNYKNALSRPAQTVFFPDFDLSSYEILLDLAALHPGAPLYAFIPKQTGILSAATLAPQADAEATFDSRALTVHHVSLTVGSIVSELYYDGCDRILEVDVPSQTFAVVRDNFQLKQPPPPPAEAAPAQAAPNDQQSAQPQ